VHTPRFVEELARVVPGHKGHLDPDTFYSPRSWEVALAAAGAAVDSATSQLRGE